METVVASPNFAGDRSEIGGYEVVATYTAEQTWLAVAPGERKVVLKSLDEDCLWKGQLHPNIKDRLARVRELAHAGVANLYGVERDGELTYLVWEYVEGRTLGEYAASPACGQRDLLVAARELVLAIEMLHARGIVHGMIKASNAIVDRDGRVVLTHVSPLLYTEPGDDVQAVLAVLGDLVERRGEDDSPLGRLLAEVAGYEELTLRRLATRMGALLESRESGSMAEVDQAEARSIRRRALAGASATAVLGVGLFVGLKVYANSQLPKVPEAPQASPAALQPAAPGERAQGEGPSARATGGGGGGAWAARRAAR